MNDFDILEYIDDNFREIEPPIITTHVYPTDDELEKLITEALDD